MHESVISTYGYVRSHHVGGCTVLAFHGEIDIAAALEIQPRLDAATSLPRCRVVIDLSGVDFLDASGLRLLCRARLRVTEGAGLLVLAAPPPRVVWLLRLTRLDGCFTVLPTLDEALRRAAGPVTTP
ncbi:STAS domain-containing protein [Streptomyces sp. NPDC041068]|uniref:STAS domain-containing protein n=1 Tax=Streptomyces sp. NPDC041068 TaxID=3155130 RepID=UPI0033E5D712